MEKTKPILPLVFYNWRPKLCVCILWLSGRNMRHDRSPWQWYNFRVNPDVRDNITCMHWILKPWSVNKADIIVSYFNLSHRSCESIVGSFTPLDYWLLNPAMSGRTHICQNFRIFHQSSTSNPLKIEPLKAHLRQQY